MVIFFYYKEGRGGGGRYSTIFLWIGAQCDEMQVLWRWWGWMCTIFIKTTFVQYQYKL